ncbi:hypothetical protein A1O3_07909 [Capronia epimyces CBS 606.96]|uniref:Protein transport protein sec16 n=1 Tax=Capronia epimyces CBS 606.96 TaxID=1182542 RepID=W9XQM1_9EURO|nr:uncharacterized protein A1O3_07909 [Capronia epimyces CBS 606.96]EXJ79630.1 hypothetical protein A1O3_07909 [Capronia epimyces CBS 606.96]
METANPINHGSSGIPASAQSGHWFPAFRPEIHEETSDDTHAGIPSEAKSRDRVNGEMHTVPSTPFSARQGTDVAPEKSTSTVLTSEGPGAARTEYRADEPSSLLSSNQAWPSASPDATTGADEIPSDDDDERLDPAWGIKRLDTSHILDSIHRSTTFPELATPDPSGDHVDVNKRDEPEARTLNEGAEESRGTEQNDVQNEVATEPQRLDWLDDSNEVNGDAHPWTAPEQVEAVDEGAQRFDEGVPLIQAEERVDTDRASSRNEPGPNPFDTVADDEETLFFSSITNSAPAADNPSLDRKSTAQVLDSLNFSAKDKSEFPIATEQAEPSFFDEVAKLQNEATEGPPPEDVDAMWAAALEDDEFLVEDADDLLPDSEPGSPSSFLASIQESAALPDEKFDISSSQPPSNTATQQNPLEIQRPANPYAPHQPSTSDLLQLSPTARTTHNNIGISRPELAPLTSFQSHLQQDAPPQPMKSFVDQARDGYKSPYDLPMDIAKHRRRPHVPHPVQTTRPVAPPPRSSSLSENPLQSPFSPHVPPAPASAALPPTEPVPMDPPRSVSAFEQPARPKARSGSSSFFEELPISFKPRHASSHASSHGHYIPHQHASVPPPPLPSQSQPSMPLSPPLQQVSPPRAADPYSQYQLRAPERLDPYANAPLEPPVAPPSTLAARYSPAPVTSAQAPRMGPSPRYSPAPPPQTAPSNLAHRYASKPAAAAPPQAPPTVLNRHVSQPPPHPSTAANILPFQPRTSSPLAYHKRSVDESANDIPISTSYLPKAPQVSTTGVLSHQTGPTDEDIRFTHSTITTSPPQRSMPEHLPPPRRSQTQSPSKQRPQPNFPTYSSDVINRPASAYIQPPADRTLAQLDSVPPRPDFAPRGLAPELEFVRPLDDTQFDPLERWKGAPIFKFGFGGSIVSTFPKHVPRYTAGASRPQIKASPGAVSTRSTKDILPHAELLNSFPGPLRSKSKKKELLTWMSNYISSLEASVPDAAPIQSPPDLSRHHHEKTLLWKIIRVLVEHDGILDGAALKAVNPILAPEVHAVDEPSASQYHGDQLFSGIYRPAGGNIRPESVDPMAVEVLRKQLLAGNRQAAVTHAMDNRLWSHALVISSTMDRSMWSQVVREFVRQEVKTVGTNAESLSALYEIFGGNVEDSIDELVPPSARAGLQMVSRVDAAGPTRNALEGLNRWKETLSLVLNNRCQGDHQALAVLGKLLEDYNRIEAGHICYLFSRNPAKPLIVGGLDDEQTPIVLLGADHKAKPFDFGRDQEAILLTEIYEFATSVLAPGAPLSFMPHLSVYKLQRATVLAEGGFKSEAQLYCDAIAATFKSSTKVSPYYHPLFLSELDDLSNRLKQTPSQGSSSWIGRPSLEKVSGSVWNKFSSFVVGDDSDAESKGSGKDAAEAGPFANVTGTPSISRSGSQSDLFGSYPQNVAAAGSRYAPNGIQSARSSSELTRGRPSFDQQRSPPTTSYFPANRQYEPLNMLQQGSTAPPLNPYQALATSPPQTSYPQSPRKSSYLPNNVSRALGSNEPPVQQQTYLPTPSSEEVIQQPYGYAPELVASSQNPEPAAYGAYEPMQQPETQAPFQQGQGYGGYEPPTQSYSYEPPSGDDGYVPYEPELDSPEEERETKPKKKSFMDDDDDDFPSVANQAPPSERKPTADEDEAARRRANDAAAEATFRAAAEADAAQAKEKEQAKRASSWFAGWLGGKKGADGLDGASKSAEPKVYKANLGESKMKLYFDKELGKWVNPDNPDASKKTATPPPPRMGGTPAPPMGAGGHSRAPGSGPTSYSSLPNMAMAPPSAPSSRTGTPVTGPGITNVPSPPTGLSGPPSGSGTPPLGATLSHGLAPPPGPGSRPGTATSNASSIDDLIGPATGRKSAKGGKRGKTGRYVDVMAK